MRGITFEDALNYEIGSNDNTTEAAKRSQDMRAPLYDMEVAGKRAQGKIRPHWVERAVEKIGDGDKEIADERGHLKELTRKALGTPKGLLDAIHPPLLIAADGALLGPALSEIFPTFESDQARFLTGLAASYTIALGGAAIGYVARGSVPPPYDKILGVLGAGAVGAAVGNFLGEATAEGISSVVLFRTALTACTCAAMAAMHFKRAKANEAWSPVREQQKVVSKQERKQEKEVKEVKKFQEENVATEWSHRSRECSHHEGLLVGAFAHREQGLRASYVIKKISNWMDKLFSVAAFLFVSFAAAPDAQADSRTVVLDTTASIVEKDLALRAAEAVPLGYGDTVSAFAMGCNGLAPIYRGEVLKISKAGHRKSLKKVQEKLLEALRAAAEEKGGNCSPLKDSLLTLAVDLKLRVNQGEKVMLIVASDFLDTTRRKVRVNIYPSHARGSGSSDARQKAETTGEPFKGVDVLVVFPSAKGKNPKEREQAVALAKNLFAGAMSLRFAY